MVTGAGRGFCSGGNVKGFVYSPDDATPPPLHEQRNHMRHGVHRVPRAVSQLDKPYIAAVNGPAAGAGMDMASMADIRIASDKAKFVMSYINMGLVTGDGGAYFLPRIVGLAKAYELIWGGEPFDAHVALQMGYVNHVVPHEEFAPFAQVVCREVRPQAAHRHATHQARGAQGSAFRPRFHPGLSGMGDADLPQHGGLPGGPAGVAGKAPAGVHRALGSRSPKAFTSSGTESAQSATMPMSAVLENGRLRVGIDRHHRAGRLNAAGVVEIAAHRHADIEIGRDAAAGNADLAGVRQPALIRHLPRRCKLAPRTASMGSSSG